MDYLTFLTLSYTGMRVGELVALKWQDIDFDENTISITKTYYNRKNNTIKYKLVTPKTEKSKRKIIVEDDVIEALKLHKEAQEKINKRLGDSYYNKEFIFAKTEKHLGYPIFVKVL